MISVLIPYASPCPHRGHALAWVVERWRQALPGCEIIIGLSPQGPWRKGLAVADAAGRSHGEILVVTDADVWCDRTVEAAGLVAAGRPWAIPHRTVYRLSEVATTRVLEGADPKHTMRVGGREMLSEARYEGIAGGGIVIVSREAYEAAPIDGRFAGWGGEDEAWAMALDTIAGPCRRLDGLLWHLWHPPPQRLSRLVGSHGNDALKRRYREAYSHRDQMLGLVAEGAQLLASGSLVA